MELKLLVITVFFSLAACGGKGGGDIADRASKAAEAACACKDLACTKPQIKALNKMSITEEDTVKKLSPERAEVYKAAQTKAADCQTALR